MAILQQGDMIDKYRIERSLGSGGMGEVYLVRHVQLNVLRAMKILHDNIAEEDPEFRERFIREAKFAAKIQHPNIVAVMDVELNSDSGFSYIVMEYVDGQTVSSILQHGPLPESQAIYIIREVTRGLAYAAESGIVHRDIKPANIMITKSGEVKLADLGIAKNINSTGNTMSLTMEGTMIGTPAYASPEQCRCARDVDTRADIYSLGATLYEMLTGKPPFTGKNEFDIIAKVLKRMPVPMEQLAHDVSPGTVKLVRRMMAKSPEDRQQNMLDLMGELYQFELPDEENALPPLMRKLIEKRAGEVAEERLTVMLQTTIKRQHKSHIFSIVVTGLLLLGSTIVTVIYFLLTQEKSGEKFVEKFVNVEESPGQVLQEIQTDPARIAADQARGIVYSRNGKVLLRYPENLTDTEYSIPAGITRIESMAFANNAKLQKVVLPDTLTSIGDKAFLNCRALTTIQIPDTIARIGSQTFSGCTALKELNLPESLTTIDERAFSQCTSLTALVFPQNVEITGDDLFTRCPALKEVTIPRNLVNPERLGRWGLPRGCRVFSNGQQVYEETVSAAKDKLGVRFSQDGKTLLRYPPELGGTHYTIPDGATGIAENAFSGCSNLNVVIVPASVLFIDHNAFAGVQSVKLAPGNQAFFMDSSGALVDKQEKRLVFFPRGFKGKYVIPDTIKSICGHVFYHCDELTELVVPDSVETIEDHAFSNCGSLVSLTLPDSFLDSRINDWNLPTRCQVKSVTEYNDELTAELAEKQAVPATAAPAAPVVAAPAPKPVEIPLDTNKIEADKKRGISFSTGGRSLLNYPSGLPDAHYEVPDGITSISGQAFFGAKHLKSIKLPDSLTTISNQAFVGSSIEEIALPQKLSFFSASSFNSATKLKLHPENKFFTQRDDGSIFRKSDHALIYVPRNLSGSYTIPPETKIIASFAFSGCANLKAIKLHPQVNTIGVGAFQFCRSLRGFSFPEGLTRIPDSVLLGCTSLKYVILPDSIRVLETHVFSSCSQLEDLRLPKHLTSIGSEAFNHCHALRTLKLPETLVLIGNGAFNGCSNLREIVIPDTCQSIGNGAFSGCNAMKTISFPASYTKDYIRKLGLPEGCRIKRRAK